MARTRLRFLACAAWITILANSGLAADQPNFSGKYSLKGRNMKHDRSLLEVVQTADSVEVTTTKLGKRVTSRYPLTGGPADCSSPEGTLGKCAAHFKRKELILQATFVTRLQLNGTPTRANREERWRLSDDARKLTIEIHTDLPDLAESTVGFIPEEYVRVDNP